MSKPAPAKSARPTNTPDADTRQMALRIAQQLDEKQAKEIVILDVSGPLVIADYFVVATVQSPRQGQALAKDLDAMLKAERGAKRRNTGGLEGEDSNWVLLDFGDIVVHLFTPEARAYYGMETLWADVPRLPFTPSPKQPTTPTEFRQPTLDGFGLGGFGALQPLDGDDDPATR